MTGKIDPIQPGKDLHEVVVGAFRARGQTLSEWCKANEVHATVARNATYGLTSGPKGTALLDRIIDAAGRASVEALYRARLEDAVAGLKGEIA